MREKVDPILENRVDRREFIHATLIKTGTGLAVLSELMGPGITGRELRFISAAERARGSSFCQITPAAVPYSKEPHDWTFTYKAGQDGLPTGWALMIRCISAIQPENHLSVTSSWPGFSPKILLLKNSGIKRVIWIEPGGVALPPGETITVSLQDYPQPTIATDCAFSILEMNPEGPDPEIGSGYTFLEVPTKGGRLLPGVTSVLNVVLPARAMVNEPMRIRISALDGKYHGTPDYQGAVELITNHPFKDLPGTMTFTPGDKGSRIIEAVPLLPGIIRIGAADGSISTESNPCVCTAEPVEDHVFFGDYHVHSFHCDGTFKPYEDYDHARRFAFLDFAMHASHDAWPFPHRGLRSAHAIQTAAESVHEPGEFVALHGYEWSHNHPFSADSAQGHKVVIFLHPEHLLPLIAFSYGYEGHTEDFMPPTTLIRRLVERAGKDVMIIPHHLPLYKWWVFPGVAPDAMGGPLPALRRETIDAVQPVAEVFSKAHGNNESHELKDWIKPPTTWGWKILPTFWQDGLKEGVKAGAVCASDNHDWPMGHRFTTALTGVMAPEHTREAIFRALQERRTYGTSGPRVFIDFRLQDAKVGETVKWKTGDPAPAVEATVVSPVPIDFIEVVKVTPGSAAVLHVHQAAGERETAFTHVDGWHDGSKWTCYYLRIHLDNDAHGAWTSPIWIEPHVMEHPGSPSAG